MELSILTLPFASGEKPNVLHPVVLRHEGETLLVDCGYAGMRPLLEEALREHGLSLAQLTGVLITHHDIDHMGALAELKEAYPQLKVYAPRGEEPYVSGQRKSLRLQQAEDLYACMSEEQKPGARQFQEVLRRQRPVAVDHAFEEDGALPFFPGVHAVHTPGHMPGHVSLYIPELRTLVAADAVVVAEDGELEIANPQFALDLPAAVASVRKLMGLAVDRLVCYHGGVVEGDVQERLGRLAGRYGL